MNGELTIAMPRCRELDPSDHGRRHRWVHKARARVLRVTRIITRLSPWSRTGTIRSGWLSYWFRQSATLLWTLHSGGSLVRPQSAARIARSENAGDSETSHRCPTAAGVSRWRFPLTGRSRRDSIRALVATGQTSGPHRCLEHLHGPNPQHGVDHVSG